MSSPSRDHDGNTDSDSDDDQKRLFSDVLASICYEQVPIFCSAIRKENDECHGVYSESNALPTVGNPMFGSYHVLLPVCFHDSLKWLLKVPAQGTRIYFDDSASKALRTEASTMNFLRLNTSIPIPNVLAFKASIDNELRCPYILMEFVDGISLYDCWFDESRENREQHRANALRDIAAAMAQLDRFSFDWGGSLTIGKDGKVQDISPMRCVDHKAELDRIFRDDGVDEICYFSAGPFSEVSAFYTRYLDHQPESTEPVDNGLRRLLRLFLEWIPEPEDSRKKFVIAHPDFDIQNFIVSSDGHLRAIIDWDGVSAVPRNVGYESYPGWLTRDWDPAMYGWTENMELGFKPEGLWEDSPETLSRHRTQYQLLMRSALSHIQETDAAIPPNGPDQLKSGSRTANSIYLENLLIASSNPACMFPILERFIEKINEILGHGLHEEFNIFDISRALVDDEPSEVQLVDLKNGFQAIFLPQNGCGR